MANAAPATKINSYRDLLVWKAAMRLAVACYGATTEFPKDEIYGMTSQIRRSSTSIPANIAEGFGRESTGSFVQFLRIAQGSLKELETHLLLSVQIGLLRESEAERLLVKAEELGKMLRPMIRRLHQRTKQ